MDEAIKQNLLTTLGLDKLPESQQVKLLETIGRVIYEGVFMRVMEELDLKKKEEFEKVLRSAKSEHEILHFLEQHVPEIDSILSEEVEKFKAESMSFVQKLG
jgi:hypothetical protein